MRVLSDFNKRIRALQIINHLAVIIGFYSLFTGFIGMEYLYIGIVFYILFVLFGTCIGLHRYFSHRTFKTNMFWHYFLGFFGTISTVGTILGWVGLHRYHHAHTDKENDPHSPHDIGYFNAWFYNWKPSKFTRNFIKLELRDPMIIFLHKHYFKTIFLYISLLAIIDPWLTIWAYALPACGSYLSISAVTVIGHVHGYTNHDTGDTSKNSWITSILSLGEGWHNNHHHNGGSYRQGEKWWELDPSAWIIRNILVTNKQELK